MLASSVADNVPTLYERLGGEGAMDAVVKVFYKKVLADPRINGMFAKTNMARQHNMQKAFMSHAFGGPSYDGKNMRKAHKRLGITDHHFDAVAEHIKSTLDVRFGLSKVVVLYSFLSFFRICMWLLSYKRRYWV